VVLRPEAIRQRLLRLEEVVSGLEALRDGATGAARDDRREQWAVERGLQLGAGVVLDVGNNILSAHFGESAQDYEDIVGRLGARGVIPSPLREELKGLGGFRNILVHGYLQLDPARVAEALRAAPGCFSRFVGAVRGWLDALPRGH
jgi:uncharacterized protein YutE (UPF0331/DUF86 family)